MKKGAGSAVVGSSGVVKGCRDQRVAYHGWTDRSLGSAWIVVKPARIANEVLKLFHIKNKGYRIDVLQGLNRRINEDKEMVDGRSTRLYPAGIPGCP